MFRRKRYERQEGTVYISGPITGVKDWKKNFDRAYKELKSWGFGVVHNPREIAEAVEMTCQAMGKKAEYKDYMKADIRVLLNCTHIYMLAGWENSRGAVLEKSIADALGMEVIYDTERA